MTIYSFPCYHKYPLHYFIMVSIIVAVLYIAIFFLTYDKNKYYYSLQATGYEVNEDINKVTFIDNNNDNNNLWNVGNDNKYKINSKMWLKCSIM